MKRPFLKASSPGWDCVRYDEYLHSTTFWRQAVISILLVIVAGLRGIASARHASPQRFTPLGTAARPVSIDRRGERSKITFVRANCHFSNELAIAAPRGRRFPLTPLQRHPGSGGSVANDCHQHHRSITDCIHRRMTVRGQVKYRGNRRSGRRVRL